MIHTAELFDGVVSVLSVGRQDADHHDGLVMDVLLEGCQVGCCVVIIQLAPIIQRQQGHTRGQHATYVTAQ